MLLGAAAGCGVGAEPPAALMQMSPAAGLQRRPARRPPSHGPGFRPAIGSTPASGSARSRSSGFSATLIARTGRRRTGGASRSTGGHLGERRTLLRRQHSGRHPRRAATTWWSPIRAGSTARLAAAFTSLGARRDAARRARSSSPADGGVVGAGADGHRRRRRADDGYGQLAALAGDWRPPRPTRPRTTARSSPARRPPPARSPSSRPTPAADPRHARRSTAEATDSGGLIGDAQIAVSWSRRPSATGDLPRRRLDPGRDGGDHLGRRTSSPGRPQVAFDGAAADGLLPSTPTSITALTPPAPARRRHGDGHDRRRDRRRSPARSPSSPPPIVREVSPDLGPGRGLHRRSRSSATTSRYSTRDHRSAATPLLCPMFVNANRIEGYVPPGAGTELVTAYDPIAGGQPARASRSSTWRRRSARPTRRRPTRPAPFADGGCPGAAAREAALQADAAGARRLGAAARRSPATRRCTSARAPCAARSRRTS